MLNRAVGTISFRKLCFAAQHFFSAKTPSAQSFAEEILCGPQRSLHLCVEFLVSSGSAGLGLGLEEKTNG